MYVEIESLSVSNRVYRVPHNNNNNIISVFSVCIFVFLLLSFLGWVCYRTCVLEDVRDTISAARMVR